MLDRIKIVTNTRGNPQPDPANFWWESDLIKKVRPTDPPPVEDPTPLNRYNRSRSPRKQPCHATTPISIMTKLAPLLAVLLLLLPPLATAQDPDTFIPLESYHQHPDKCCAGRSISVTGTGRRSFATSIAVIQIAVEATRPTARDAQQAVATKSARLTRFLKEAKVEKLQTTGVSLNANRNFTASPPTIVGYSGSNSLSFEVAVARAGALLDGSVKNGASKIIGVSFKATADVTDAARKEALADATRAARAEAEVVAATLGGGVREARAVKIVDTFTPEASDVAGAGIGPRLMAAAAPISVVVAGESSVSARVTIVFVLYPST